MPLWRQAIVAAAAVTCILVLFGRPASAQSSSPRRLTIATRVLPPLVMRGRDGALSGFSIDLWRAVAAKAALPSDFVVKDTLPELLSVVRDGKADAAIAGISMTSEREASFDFSQPILDAGLQILVREPGRNGPSLDPISAILQARALYELLAMLVLLALIPVPLVWWAERRAGGEGLVESGSPVRGLGKTLFWSLAILGGQAEEMPRTVVGRVVAIVAVFISVLFVSYFTATTTAILTVRELNQAIRGPADLPGRTVGTIAGSTAAAYLAAEGIRGVTFANLDDAVAELDASGVDAVVYDAPVLMYYASHAGHGRVRIAGTIFRQEQYGILLPPGSTLRKSINTALLALRESGEYRAIHTNWFGQD